MGRGLELGPSEQHQSHFTDEEAEPQDPLATVATEFTSTQKRAFKEGVLCASPVAGGSM